MHLNNRNIRTTGRPPAPREGRSARRARTAVRRAAALAVGLSLALVLGACDDGDSGDAGAAPQGKKSGSEVRLPEADATFDYQLGGAYPPPSGVEVVSRDRGAKPAAGKYNICYVNAFQAQPGEKAEKWWREKHPELLLRDGDKEGEGDLVIDEDWDEPLLDISTKAKRTALAEIAGRWIDGCADAGYDAIEADNLDSYERSDDLLTPKHAAAFARLLAERSHASGLAFAQKNTTDLIPQHRKIGFDFAVVEECAHYKECGDWAEAYDDRVFDIEYVPRDYAAACRAHGEALSITLRDRDVRPKGESGHVYKHC